MRLPSINTFGRGYTQESEKGYFRTVSAQEEKKDVDWSQGNISLKLEGGFEPLERLLSDSFPVAAARAKTFTGKAQSAYGRKNKMAVCNTGEPGTV